jgi:hypothetical protein
VIHSRIGGAMKPPIGLKKECAMRSLVLGVIFFASLGFTASAAEPPSNAKVVSHAERVCHWVTADRPLRLLRDIIRVERRTPSERLASRPISTPVKEPVVKVSRPATFVRAARLASRVEPAHVERMVRQHLSLIVGIGF